jgi:hypothetical protein
MAEVISALDALDVPFEPPSTRSWTPDLGDATLGEAGPDLERTVIHLGSEPPSWQSAEPRGEDSVPPSPAAASSNQIAPEGRTIFAPSEPVDLATTAPKPTDEPIVDDAARPIAEASLSASTLPPVAATSSLPPLVAAPADEEVVTSEATIFEPSVEPSRDPDVGPPSGAAEVEARNVPLPQAALISIRPGKEDETASPIPPAMDVAYKSPRKSPSKAPGLVQAEAEREAQGAAAPARAPFKGKGVAVGVIGAVVLVGVGFAVLSSQKKAALPALAPTTTSSAPPPVASRADELIAAALPNVPCAWLTLSHGQNADGSTSLKISGAAGDPAGANRAVANAARAAGAGGLQVDTTEILPADQGACPLLDTANRFRGQTGAVPSLVAQQARPIRPRASASSPYNPPAGCSSSRPIANSSRPWRPVIPTSTRISAAAAIGCPCARTPPDWPGS